MVKSGGTIARRHFGMLTIEEHGQIFNVNPGTKEGEMRNK